MGVQNLLHKHNHVDLIINTMKCRQSRVLMGNNPLILSWYIACFIGFYRTGISFEEGDRSRSPFYRVRVPGSWFQGSVTSSGKKRLAEEGARTCNSRVATRK